MNKCVITTYTGLEVNPLDLRPEDIRIEDIAHALALVNRFNGHTKKPLSVAQHSVYVSRLCPNARLAGLLHDASEAYLGDMTRWLKMTPKMQSYREAEECAQLTIYAQFRELTTANIFVNEIDYADRVMVRFEGSHKYGVGSKFKIDHPNYPPLTQEEIESVGKWQPWTWQTAEEVFLAEYRSITLAARTADKRATRPVGTKTARSSRRVAGSGKRR